MSYNNVFFLFLGLFKQTNHFICELLEFWRARSDFEFLFLPGFRCPDEFTIVDCNLEEVIVDERLILVMVVWGSFSVWHFIKFKTDLVWSWRSKYVILVEIWVNIAHRIGEKRITGNLTTVRIRTKLWDCQYWQSIIINNTLFSCDIWNNNRLLPTNRRQTNWIINIIKTWLFTITQCFWLRKITNNDKFLRLNNIHLHLSKVIHYMLLLSINITLTFKCFIDFIISVTCLNWIIFNLAI